MNEVKIDNTNSEKDFGLNVQVTGQTARINDLESKVQRLEKQSDSDRSSLFTVFGIFASIIIFLTVEVQILQKAESLVALTFLSLVTVTGLLSFLSLYHYITTTFADKNRKHSLYVVVGVLVLLIIATCITAFFAFKTNSVNQFNITMTK